MFNILFIAITILISGCQGGRVETNKNEIDLKSRFPGWPGEKGTYPKNDIVLYHFKNEEEEKLIELVHEKVSAYEIARKKGDKDEILSAAENLVHAIEQLYTRSHGFGIKRAELRQEVIFNLFNDLEQNGKKDLTLSLIWIHSVANLVNGFWNFLIDPFMAEGKSYAEKAVKSLGLIQVMVILKNISNEHVQAASQNTKKELVEYLLSEYVLFSESAHWKDLLDVAYNFEIFQKKIGSEIPLLERLEYFGKVIKKSINGDPWGKDFGKNFDYIVPINWWIRLKKSGPDSVQNRPNRNEFSPIADDPSLDINIIQSLFQRFEVEELCKKFESSNVPSQTIDASELEEKLSAGLPVGCTRVVWNSTTPGLQYGENPLDPPTLHIRVKRAEMPIYSVLVAHDLSIKIEVEEYFEASVFDLSAKRKHPNLDPPSVPGSEYDSIAFPIMIGVHIKDHPQLRNGLNFVVSHFEYRYAKDGLPQNESQRPLNGFNGGSLEIVKLNPKAEVRAPALVSKGGEGQEPQAEMKGGKADTSEYVFLPLKNYVSRYSIDNPQLKEQGKAPFLIDQPGYDLLIKLLELAEKENGKRRIYMLPDYLGFLAIGQKGIPNEQTAKVIKICRDEGFVLDKTDPNPDLSKCFNEHIGPKFVSFIETELLSNDPVRRANAYTLFSVKGLKDTNTYSTKEGNLGFRHLNASPGHSGSLKYPGAEK